MDLYLSSDSNLTTQQRHAFEAHVQKCSKCAHKYQEKKWIIDLVRKYWSVSKDTLSLIERAKQSSRRPMTIEEGWTNINQRITTINRQERIRRTNSWGMAVAACLLVGACIWFAYSINSKPELSPNTAVKQVASVKHSIRVELVTESGNRLLAARQEISTSKGKLKKLIINGKHQLIMNTDTILSVEPLASNEHVGCMVRLASGEIFSHVEHDGNSFVVSTPHGQAIITGTAFDIKVTDAQTSLIVSQGSVKLGSESGYVDVTTGHLSKIRSDSIPTKPQICNVAGLTSWAMPAQIDLNLAKAVPEWDSYDFKEIYNSTLVSPPDLESIDYSTWIKENQDWFKQAFPWIFQLKEALAKEGVEADYPELLIKTGDIWQFVCLEVSPARFSVINPDSLLKTASDYGFDKQWLLENIPAAKSALEKLVLSENSFTGLKAFERWLEYLDKTKGLTPPTPIYSFHASKYLANTRSLIWFAVRNGKYDLTDQERVEILGLLQEEVTAACKCQNDELYPIDEQKTPFCNEDTYQYPVGTIIKNIEIMKAIEKQLLEYR
jgi:ferric-dicitrate binding protein FerR (iron transport regulator)